MNIPDTELEGIVEEFMWQMKSDQHNICGQYIPAFCDKQEKRLRTLLSSHDTYWKERYEALHEKHTDEAYQLGKTHQRELVRKEVEGIKEKYSRRELQEGGYSQACDDILQALDNLK